MSKILGLDLGTNSIGWAVIDNKTNQMSCGVRILKNEITQNNQFELKKLRLKRVDLSTKFILSSILTSTLFGLALINIQDWQYWTSLGIGGLLVIISILKDK